MKKIMFNDKYGLTKAVLEGRKTQTRRLFTLTLHEGDLHGDLKEVYPDKVFRCVNRWMFEYKKKVFDIPTQNYPKYSIGEIVAIAQSYKDIFTEFSQNPNQQLNIGVKNPTDTAGWANKMFVRGNLMPHQIRITDVRVEKLQDISGNDCLKEGVVVNEPKIKGGIDMYYPCEYLRSCAKEVGWGRVFHTPREAFAHLINKVSKKDVWEENPYVFVYDFELVK